MENFYKKRSLRSAEYVLNIIKETNKNFVHNLCYTIHCIYQIIVTFNYIFRIATKRVYVLFIPNK